MELQDSLKSMRRELDMTQAEMAASLGVSIMTINRWETGKTTPRPRMIVEILSLAESRGASDHCIRRLKSALSDRHRDLLRVPESMLFPVDRTSICQLVDQSVNAIYVADLETDELLYVNRKAEQYIGRAFQPGAGQKCYQFVYGLNAPCAQCPKHLMQETNFSDAHVTSPNTGRCYHVRGKRLDWNGKPAHVQYFYDETSLLEAQYGFRQLVDTLAAGICVFWVYGDGRIFLKYLSEGYFALVGSSRKKRTQYAGYGVMNAVCEADRARVEEQARAAYRSNASFRLRCRVCLDNGALRELCLRANFIRREAEKALYHGIIVAGNEETA